MQLIKIIVLGLLVGLLLFIVACGEDEPVPEPQPKIEYHSSDIVTDETWSGDTTHIVTENISIYSTLTISSGTKIEFESGKSITITTNGKIISDGTNDTITIGSKSDIETRGYWDGIIINSNKNNIFKNVIFQYGGNLTSGMISLENGTATIEKCVIKGSLGPAIYIKDKVSNINLMQNTITSCLYVMKLYVHNVNLVKQGLYEDNDTNSIYLMTDSIQDLNVDIHIINPGVSYILDGALKAYSKITIDSGVIIKMKDSSTRIRVRTQGTLICEGTETYPVKFTSNQLTPAKGDWKGIRFDPDANISECALYNTIVEYAGGDEDDPAGIYLDQAYITIHNSIIRHNNGYGIYIEPNSLNAPTGNFYNNIYEDNTSGGSRLFYENNGIVGQWEGTVPFLFNPSSTTYEANIITIAAQNCDGTFRKIIGNQTYSVPVRYDISTNDSLVIVVKEESPYHNFLSYDTGAIIVFNYQIDTINDTLLLTEIYSSGSDTSTLSAVYKKKGS